VVGGGRWVCVLGLSSTGRVRGAVVVVVVLVVVVVVVGVVLVAVV
jgi:hypothetical protein